VKAYYEDLWERLPTELSPPDESLRAGFLLGALRPGETVLDLGCGDGWLTRRIAAAGVRVTGVEVAEAALARARSAAPEVDFRLAPIDGPLPLDDAGFDVVWSSEVIEHVADTGTWLNEIRRVLRPGGRLLLTTPSHGRLRILLGGIERFSEPLGDHLHLYTKRSLCRVLGEFGFASAKVRAAAGAPGLRRLLLARAVRS
jgi:SAM-dependent methyltransferase